MVIGQFVVFVDPVGKEHNAVVTQVWGDPDSKPSVNLVYVSDDDTKVDQYGRQIERNTSVVHRSNQAAHGMFYYELSEQLVAG